MKAEAEIRIVRADLELLLSVAACAGETLEQNMELQAMKSTLDWILQDGSSFQGMNQVVSNLRRRLSANAAKGN